MAAADQSSHHRRFGLPEELRLNSLFPGIAIDPPMRLSYAFRPTARITN
jgi:hypothetical protein